MASSALKRVVTVVLERLGMHLWGFPPRLMAPIVVQLGPLRALAWFAWNMPRYERTLKEFGAVRTHLICTAISLVNGCRYCGYGHGYALQLAYLREHHRLFPLSEHTMGLLRGLPPGVIRHRMAGAAQRAGLHSEVRWVERAIALTLADDRRPTDDDDVRISHLVRMFGVLNSVGISDDTEPDQAHTPLNKDRALKQRYARLRAAAGT
jgi:alkylhydroperoxidase family enzyme